MSEEDETSGTSYGDRRVARAPWPAAASFLSKKDEGATLDVDVDADVAPDVRWPTALPSRSAAAS